MDALRFGAGSTALLRFLKTAKVGHENINLNLYSILVSKMWNDGLVIGYLSKFHAQEALSMAAQNNFYGLVSA